MAADWSARKLRRHRGVGQADGYRQRWIYQYYPNPQPLRIFQLRQQTTDTLVGRMDYALSTRSTDRGRERYPQHSGQACDGQVQPEAGTRSRKGEDGLHHLQDTTRQMRRVQTEVRSMHEYRPQVRRLRISAWREPAIRSGPLFTSPRRCWRDRSDGANFEI